MPPQTWTPTASISANLIRHRSFIPQFRTAFLVTPYRQDQLSVAIRGYPNFQSELPVDVPSRHHTEPNTMIEVLLVRSLLDHVVE